MANQPFIVTLDGPAGVGKTTLARSVAAKLGVAYLDTGAMFRTLGLKFGEEVDRTDPRVLAEEARGLRFELTGSGAETVLHCNGKAVGPEIRTEEVGMLAARVGAVPEIREVLKEQQRRIGAATSLVAEGRDMGTVVFPFAPVKIFLTAEADVRAKRRYDELTARGVKVDYKKILNEIHQRDEIDEKRSISPLRQASDALLVDSSSMNAEQVADKIVALARKAVHA